jgi:seryl-tRNA synthetase
LPLQSRNQNHSDLVSLRKPIVFKNNSSVANMTADSSVRQIEAPMTYRSNHQNDDSIFLSNQNEISELSKQRSQLQLQITGLQKRHKKVSDEFQLQLGKSQEVQDKLIIEN